MLQNQTNLGIDSYRERVSKFSSELDIGLIIYIFRKSLWFVALFIVLALSVAYIYLRYSQPIYQSSSVIQINDNSQMSQVLQINPYETNTDNIAEAIEQIKSKVFLTRVVEKSDVQVSYFNEGTFKNNELYKSSPYFVKFNAKDKSIYGVKIYIDIENKINGKLTFNIGGQKNEIPFKFNSVINHPLFDLVISLNKDANTEQIKSVIEEKNKSYFIIQNIDQVTAELQNKLTIKFLNDAAKTILVTVKDINAEKAKDLVNLISDEFLIFDVERKSESSKSIISFIDDQLKVVYDDLKVSENNLQDFRKKYDFTDKDEAIKNNMLKLYNIEDEMLKIEMEEKLLAELQANIAKNKSIDTYQLISMITGSEYESSIKEYTSNIQKLLIEKETILYDVTPRSDNIKQINYNIEIQKKLLIESINALRLKYKSKYTNLLKKTQDFKSSTVREPDNDLEHARLMRLFSISEKYYTMLLEKKTEFSISKAGFVSQNVILEKAVNNGTIVSPNKKTTISIAILSALLLSLIVIFIRYFMHDKITSINDIIKNSDASINVLGIVPNYPSDVPVSQLVVDKNPKSQIAEAFRSIRSNFQFINNSEGPKIIAVTSTISGEGKTFVALNISGILAYTGKKVILMDLDMRKPKIHKGFGVKNTLGMSTILTGISSYKECVIKSEFPNLDYITAGPIPPNPSELIIDKRLDNLIEDLKKEYDYIVFDNPPIGLVTDGITTIQKAQYPIYVFRSDYSKKSFVQILDKLSNENNIKNLSIVLNGVDTSRAAYGYKYGYGYGYGYGNENGYYGEEEKSTKKRSLKKVWKS